MDSPLVLVDPIFCTGILYFLIHSIGGASVYLCWHTVLLRNMFENLVKGLLL